MNDSYISILIDSMIEKSKALDEVIERDQEQTELIGAEKPDLDAIKNNFDSLGELAKKISKLDDGFEVIYEKVRDEILNNKNAHKDEIKRLKELVAEVTEKAIKIQTTEARNKLAVTEFFTRERRNLGTRRSAVKALNQYKHAMGKAEMQAQPYFLDKRH
ncbi:MAG: hypothetical protein K6F39_00090 [Lachnospiraceae bacterium]|nr:hypothetical protein [Lachnospiraceae bacterium]